MNYVAEQKALGNIPESNETEWSREGTTAHGYADDYLTGKVRTKVDIPDSFWEHLQGYCEFAHQLAETIGGGECIVMNEQMVPYWYEPDHFGTLDYGVVAEDASELAILDLKYGAGVYVTAEENSQGAIYAISLIKKLEAEGYVFKDDAKISIYIYQPRHRDFTGEAECWTTNYRDLLDMGIDIEDDYVTSLRAPVTDLTPSESACRFCDARVICSTRVLDMFEEVPPETNLLAPVNHDGPNLPAVHELTDQARVAIFKHHKAIAKWMTDVVADSLLHIENGTPVEGLKTVDGNRGNRSWGDNQEGAEKLFRRIPAALRFKPRVVISPAAAEKVLKSEGLALKDRSPKYQKRWNELIYRKAGSPTLVLESDDKPARITGDSGFEVIVSEEDCF